MRKLYITVGITVLGLLAVLLGATSATANRRLEVRGLEAGGAITARNNGSWTFGGGFGNIVCRRVTLRGVVTRLTVDKTATGRLPEAQMGEITEGSATECTGPFAEAVNVVLLAEPRTNGLRHQWLIRYDGFLGTLPNINGVRLTALLVSWNIERVLGGLRCQYRQTVTETRVNYPARAEGNSVEFLPNRSTIIAELSTESCPAEGEIRGRMLGTPATSLALL